MYDFNIIKNDIIINNNYLSKEYLSKIHFLKESIKNIKFDNYSQNNKNLFNLRDYKSKVIDNKNLFTNIRNILNKITEKTYEKLLIELINNVDSVYNNNNSDKDEIVNFIFKFFTKNFYMSKIYSNIYNLLCNKYNDFNIILENNIQNFNIYLESICNEELCSLDIDYYKSFFLFYSNCFNLGIIKINNILNDYQDKLLLLINNINNKEKCELISELLFIFIKNSKEIIKENFDKNDILFENINNISNYKTYNFKSLTNKIIFKHKDIMDLFK